ncbi:GNAT family N-acetyltransferase [Olivibacter sp. SDN3]|uniref:GNAT family N-acetyltransferase n=1 Tax=Olivibacter sp. SDN3 TaxID=2764720 RepID=UPI00165195C0|nr:GNAT family N-acetyltransferase [Olivibacter sp. SDN3]QNL48040.1 GNAT family N-acetyltransferase [Olivibacter sp. SDN3]
MNISTLEHIEPTAIVSTFNSAFSDYFVPLRLTLEQLETKIKADKIALNYSVGVFDHGELVAFILHGRDFLDGRQTVYNGGTGVIPDKRGMGLVKQMYNFLFPKLKENRVEVLYLEVISKNTQAIKSYERSGFKIVRKLACYRGEIKHLNIATRSDVEIKELNVYNWELMKSFWDFTPTWQNAAHVLEGMKEENISIGAYIHSCLVAYVIYNPSSKRIQQIAVDKKYRRKNIGTYLIKRLTEQDERLMSIINVEKTSVPIHLFLSKIGLEHFLDQYEMKLDFYK